MQQSTIYISHQDFAHSFRVEGQNETAADIERVAFVINLSAAGLIRTEFASMTEDGDTMIVAGRSMIKWTRKLLRGDGEQWQRKNNNSEHGISKNIPTGWM